MAKKNRKPVEPVSLPKAAQYFHPRDWKDFTAKVVEEFRRKGVYIVGGPGSAWGDKCNIAIRDTAMNYAHTESFNAFWLDIQKGKLILVGYLKPGDGRLLQIPNHALDDPNSSFDFKKAKISGSGLCFVNVGVLKVADTENVPEICEAKEEQTDRPVPVQVFRRDPTVMRDERQVIRDEKNAKVCKKLLKEDLRLWEAARKPRKWFTKPHLKNEFEQQLNKKGLSTTNSDRVFNDTWAIEMPKARKEPGRKGRRSDR